jgi:hypothetical protein
MAKDKEKDKGKASVELRPVDEDAAVDLRMVRLHEDKVEEYVELPVVKVGQAPLLNKMGEPVGREDMKTRSQEPDVGALIESEFYDTEQDWDMASIGKIVVPWGWTALVVLIFTAAIIWSLVQVGKSEQRRREVEKEALVFMELDDQDELDAEATIETIEKVAHNYFDSRSVDELLRYVRHVDRVKPLMEQYYADAPPAPRRIKEFLSLDPVTIGNYANFWFVSCLLDDGSETQILVEVISENVGKVDWESHVTYQPIPWDEFAKRREGGYTGDFRVLAEKDNFYSHEFADSESLICLRLTTIGSAEVLYGYVERDGSLGQRISEQLEYNRGRSSPMLLRLHVPENLQSPRGVVIWELLTPRWVFLENPTEP